MSNEIVAVDMEHIKQLRLQGKGVEANKLVDAWQDAMKKNWAEVRRARNNIRSKIRNAQLKKQHRCLNCGIQLPEDYLKYYCVDCTKKYHRKKKASQEDAVEKIKEKQKEIIKERR